MFSLQFNYKHLYILSNKLDNDESDILIYEPPRGKTNNLNMRKQRRRSASR